MGDDAVGIALRLRNVCLSPAEEEPPRDWACLISDLRGRRVQHQMALDGERILGRDVWSGPLTRLLSVGWRYDI
jgi:hypothetical protein